MAVRPVISASERRSGGGLDIYECKTTVENEKDMIKAVAEVKDAGCNAPIKGLYEIGVEIEENSELDLSVACKAHANDPRKPRRLWLHRTPRRPLPWGNFLYSIYVPSSAVKPRCTVL